MALWDVDAGTAQQGATRCAYCTRRCAWSIAVCDKAGFKERSDQNRFSCNNVTADRNADGSITINFGDGPGAINNLPITAGWNYTVRMYQLKQDIISGKWSFPKAQPAK